MPEGESGRHLLRRSAKRESVVPEQDRPEACGLSAPRSGEHEPVMGVELDDASHARPDRQDRDEFVDQVFEAAGLPLLRVRAAASYSPQHIADLVRQAISGRAIPAKAVANQAETPICPKCGLPMVLRTAKKGDQKGQEFWGCKNYPKCRETVQT